MPTPTAVDGDVLRELLSRPGPIASVYFDLRATAPNDAQPRWRRIAADLNRQGATAGTVEALTERVFDQVPGPGVLAAFGADRDIVFALDLPGSQQPDLATHRALPHVVPVLAWMQDRPAHVVAVVDRAGADIDSYPRGVTEPTSTVLEGPDDEIERNSPGGWSQLRYQHRAEDSWEHNAATVARAVARRLDEARADLLLLAGDVRALQYLELHLPAWVRRNVTVRRISGGRSEDGSRQRRLAQVELELHLAAEDERAAMLDRLAERRGPGGSAVEGVDATVAALAAGRVETLLLAPDRTAARRAWFGPGPTDVAARFEDMPVNPVAAQATLSDVAIRSAILTGATVRIVHPAELDESAEGIAALCRYP